MATGSVLDSVRSGRPSRRSDEVVEQVKEIFDESPGKSTRQASRESGFSRHTVLKVLRVDLKYRYRPWKPYYVQQLFPEDCDRRSEFCEMMLAWFDDYEDLGDRILWSDEALFRVGGFVNRHNCHYWAESDPKEITERSMNRPTVTVWCGMTSSRVLGPYIIRETMNGERYLEMLNNFVWPAVTQWGRSKRPDIYARWRTSALRLASRSLVGQPLPWTMDGATWINRVASPQS